MKKLMESIYGVLSQYGNTTYGSIERNEDGYVDFSGIKITYSFGTRTTSENEVRQDIPLVVDIWYKAPDTFTVEDVVKNIAGDFKYLLWESVDGVVVHFSKANAFSQDIQDPDENIRRKQLNFMIRYYEYI